MNKEQIKNLIRTSDEAVKIALVEIFNRQNEEEQVMESTSERNGRGFTGVDAPFFSSLAKQVIQYGRLSDKQMAYARRDMQKYAGQLEGTELFDNCKPNVVIPTLGHAYTPEATTKTAPPQKPQLKLEVAKANKITGQQESLFLSFNYNAEVVTKIKSLRQRFYNPDKFTWEVPTGELVTLQQMFPNMEFVWANDRRPVKAETKKASAEMPKGFEFVTTPYPHQVEGLQYGLKNEAWLLADEQGLGKTKQVIDLAVSRKLRGEIEHCIIICCVNGLKYNWQKEVQLHSKESSYVVGTVINKKGQVVEGSMKDRIDALTMPRKEFFLIVNIESLRNAEIVAALNKYAKRSMIAVDEFHRCANPSSQQAKGLQKLRAQYAVAMTGTPVMNKPIDLYSILKWLGEESASFFQFKNRYCVFGGYGGYEITGYKNMGELRNRVERIMLRRLKKEVLDLPAKIRQFEYVEMTGKQELLYKEVQAMVKAHLAEIELDPNPLAQLIRLRQVTGAPEIISDTITESAKLDRMAELTEELLANGQKVVIFSQWAEMVKAAGKRLAKYQPEFILGETPVGQRQEVVNQFQSNKQPAILIGTTGAMGTGLTLTAASTAIFLDLPWTEGALAQAEDRLHRIGTKGTVNIICLTCRNTIDERIMTIVEAKRDIAEALVDGKMDKLAKRDLLEYLVG